MAGDSDMEELCSFEQRIYENAMAHAMTLRDGASPDPAIFTDLAKEYGRLLRQYRRATKMSDRATETLFLSRDGLLDKVYRDGLTGVFNRRYLGETLRNLIRSLTRSSGILSVMMLDVDFFKKFNDAYGHGHGDECLKDIAGTITGCLLRADDYIARYGGEEFTVVLPNTHESGARYLAQRILDAVCDRRIPHKDSSICGHVTVSIGLTTGDVRRTRTGDEYLRRADEALYQSKQKGRNQITFLPMD